MVNIHPTAIVHERAKLGQDVQIGPYVTIEADVVVGDRSEIQSHAILHSGTSIAEDAKVFPYAVIGGPPQHLRYQGEPTEVHIGRGVTLREMITVHRGTTFGGGKTVIEDDCYIMAYTHVAHDCRVGKGVILANAIQLAGHVTIGDYVFIGGQSAIAQFCRVGSYCYLGGGTIIRKDLPPFLIGKGYEFKIQGINAVGLSRRGFSTQTITRLRKLYRIFYLQNLTVGQALEKISIELGDSDDIRLFTEFVKNSKVGFIR